MKFPFAMKKFLFELLFVAGEMKYNFVSGAVGVSLPIKKCKQIRACKQTSMLKVTMQAFIEEV